MNVGSGSIAYSTPIPRDAPTTAFTEYTNGYLGERLVMAGRTISHGAYGTYETL